MRGVCVCVCVCVSRMPRSTRVSECVFARAPSTGRQLTVGVTATFVPASCHRSVFMKLLDKRTHLHGAFDSSLDCRDLSACKSWTARDCDTKKVERGAALRRTRRTSAVRAEREWIFAQSAVRAQMTFILSTRVQS